jgi:hypothetical protein
MDLTDDRQSTLMGVANVLLIAPDCRIMFVTVNNATLATLEMSDA